MAQPILGHGNLQPASAAGLASLELDSSLDQYVQIRIFKIIVIGDSNVGKTCLTFRFCGGTFPDKTEATIGVDFREKTVEIEGEKIKIKLVLLEEHPSNDSFFICLGYLMPVTHSVGIVFSGPL
ncbi:hypothetical protein FD755_024130 [Muntiacus reevesi]|uniref:Uncharacterized protein n=1 Tax=Muntiacus reevesi TaxID=9886 RepID=A0A5N3VVH5_MUNRE|nr:hypothetical protein FD755_024130 [Muntiacus reevesi]